MTLQARYTIRQKIADGGTAEIFLATQHGAHGFEKTVVLKRIFQAFYADPQFRNLLFDEAHIAMSLNHSNIVQVLDLGEADGQYVLALELVDGWTLDSVLRRARALNTALPPALALYVTAEVCRALAYAHAKTDAAGRPLGIVHRDTSPHNVLLSEQGEVKLTDFGIATARTRRESSLGNIIKGKIAYMSPEQASGGILDARSDLFSVGTMLYVTICRRYPFDAATDLEVLLLVKNGTYVPPEIARPGLNPEIYRVLNRAMAKAPRDRYQRAEDMLVDVEQVMRVAFRPVGQTELKRWLQDLSNRDGAPPLTRIPTPSTPAGEALAQAPPTLPTLPRPSALPAVPETIRSPASQGVATDSRKSRPPPPPAALVVKKRATLPLQPLESMSSLPSMSGTGEPWEGNSASARIVEAPAPSPESNQLQKQAQEQAEERLQDRAQERAEMQAQEPAEEQADGGAGLLNDEESEGDKAATEVSREGPARVSTEEPPDQPVPDKIPERIPGRQVASRAKSNRIAAQVSTMESALPPPTPRKSSSWVAEAVLAAAQRAGTVAAPPVGPAVPPPVPLQQVSQEGGVAPSPSEPARQPKERPRAIWVGFGIVLVLVAGFSLKVCGGGWSEYRQEARVADTKARTAGATNTTDPQAEATHTTPRSTPSARPQSAPASPTPSVAKLENASPGDAGPSAAVGTALPAGKISAQGSPPSGSQVAGVAPGDGSRTEAPEHATGGDSAADNTDVESGAESDAASGSILAGQRVSVLLKSTPPGALVSTAHRSYGSTPVAARFKVGRAYALTFARDGYAPLTKHFRVTRDANQEIVAKLRKAGPAASDSDEQPAPPHPKASQRPWFQRMFGR